MFKDIAECIEYLHVHQIKFINLAYISLDGSLKFHHLLLENIKPKDFKNGFQIIDFDNKTLLLEVDLQSAFINPFINQKNYTFLCNILDIENKENHELCPRSKLLAIQKDFSESCNYFCGYCIFNFKIFIENKHDNSPCFADEVMYEIMEVAQTMNINICSGCPVKEKSNYQEYSLILKIEDILLMADAIIKLKFIIQNIAHSYNKKTNFDNEHEWQKCLQINFVIQANNQNLFSPDNQAKYGLQIINALNKNHAELLTFALGKNKKSKSYSLILKKVFDDYCLNFNYFNLNCNIYLALAIFLHIVMTNLKDEEKIISATQNKFEDANLKEIFNSDLENPIFSQKLINTYKKYIKKKILI